MPTVEWDAEIAAVFDATYAELARPAVVDPMVEVLRELAGDGAALEFAAGTGRISLPLAARGVPVAGIELSPHMVEQMRGKPGSAAVPVTVGDMATTRVDGSFTVVYLVANTIMNVTTQEEQAAVFANAAAHLEPGGRFLIEVVVPWPRRGPISESARVFRLEADHVGIETFDDPVGQIAWSHHWVVVDGRLTRHSAPYRYVWPAELDLMAAQAEMTLEHRWAGWDRSEFTADSARHVSVWRKA